ncbi:MAG: Ig-like domain-containing protein [Patescibacteria group bacterium]
MEAVRRNHPRSVRGGGILFAVGLVALGFCAAGIVAPGEADAQSISWTPNSAAGFDDAANVYTYSLVEYGGSLYTGASNFVTGAEIWRYDGTDWAQVNDDGFGNAENVEATSLAVFGGMLYAGTSNLTTGIEIWRYDGTDWAQVNDDGFGDANNNMAYDLFEFDGKLYTGATNYATGVEMWAYDGTDWAQVNDDGFGDAGNLYGLAMLEYAGSLYIGTLREIDNAGAELWAYDGTIWAQVGTGGFGNVNNIGFMDLASFDGALFISAQNPIEGGEVWQYDGTDFEQVSSGGFDDANNASVFSLEVYNHTLYGGTTNYATGTELWSYDGSQWEQVNEDGFGQADNFSAPLLTAIGGVLYAGTATGDIGTEIWQGELPDGNGPSVSEQVPASGDSGVAVDSTISFFLDDAVYDVDSTTLDVSVAGQGGIVGGEFADGFSGSIAESGVGSFDVTIDSDHEFAYGSTVEVAVTVSDARGNESTAAWSFRATADRPSLGIVMSPASSGGPNIRVVDEQGAQISSFFAYDQSLRMGLEVAQADIDGDGTNEIIVTPGSGVESRIKAFELDGTEIASALAFNEGFTGGVTVAVGDFDGDLREEIAVAPISGGGPNIRIYSLNDEGDGLELVDWFFAYDTAFRGGVNLVAGDTDGDTVDEIITAPRSQGGPDVRVFSYNAASGAFELTANVMAYQSAYHGGVQLAAGDIDGDGADDVVVSPYLNGGPNIRVYTINVSGDLELLTWAMAYDATYRGTLSMSVGDIDGDGTGEVVLAPKTLGGPNIRIFQYENSSLALMDWFMAYQDNFRGGVNLFVADVDGDGFDEVIASPASQGGPNVRVYSMDSSTRVLDSWFWAFPEGFRGGVNFGK